MARCAITGKTTAFGNKVSHAVNKSRRKWKSNLQKVRVKIDGQVKRMYVSTKALRSGLVERV
ncbi:50S ribosomal protein L28 [Lachnospiraceae bacterium oral taxon 500]|nr:50S ribosomal protein L28 [Lachnospiraceae bacterium oral taxon 500]